jgi:hypothetical protein
VSAGAKQKLAVPLALPFFGWSREKLPDPTTETEFDDLERGMSPVSSTTVVQGETVSRKCLGKIMNFSC